MPSPEDLIEAQNSFDDFLANTQDGALVVILGVITHWVVIVLHREDGKIKQYLLDSLAHKYLHIPDEAIPANVQEFVSHYYKK